MGAAAGWFPDPENADQWRFWDGSSWTSHIAPAPRKRSWFARHPILTLLLVMFVIGFVANLLDGGETKSGAPDTPNSAGRSDAGATTRAPAAAAAPSPRKKPRLYAVLEVVDGDTVTVAYRGETSVRAIGIDTPETVSPSVPDECWGPASSRAARSLLWGRKVALVFDSSQGRLDRYDRTLAYLEVPGLGDYGLAMLKSGNAVEYTYDTPYRRQRSYRVAQAQAHRADKALWAKCGGADVPLRRRPKAQPKPQPFVAGGTCEPGYEPCVPAYPPDVDCSDVTGPITVTGSDPHGLDAEHDGNACE